MLGALWFLQRRLTRGGIGRPRRDKGITVLSRQGLGGKAQLVVVEVERTRYVLGVTEQGVSVIDRTRSPEPLADPSPEEATDVVSEFERLLAETASRAPEAESVPQPERAADPEPAPLRRHRRPRAEAAADPLQGSILSPATWRQTAQALRRGR